MSLDEAPMTGNLGDMLGTDAPALNHLRSPGLPSDGLQGGHGEEVPHVDAEVAHDQTFSSVASWRRWRPLAGPRSPESLRLDVARTYASRGAARFVGGGTGLPHRGDVVPPVPAISSQVLNLTSGAGGPIWHPACSSKSDPAEMHPKSKENRMRKVRLVVLGLASAAVGQGSVPHPVIENVKPPTNPGNGDRHDSGRPRP